MLIVPRKRILTQQPQGAVSIDWSNPITQGLVGKWLPSIRGVIAGQPSDVVSRVGKGKLFVKASTQYITVPLSIPVSITSNGVTLIAIGDYTGSNSSAQCLISATNDVDHFSLLARGDIGANICLGSWLSSSFRQFGPSGYADSKLHCYAGRSDASGNFSVFYDGIATSGSYQNSGAINSAALTKLRIAADLPDSELWDGDVYFAAVWNRALSDAEVKSISENPWQIFRAPDSRIFVPTGAGAGSGDNLTASSIIASPATVGSPLLSQKHALTASSIASAPAVVASPAITQRHALSSTAASASPAVVGSPSITQRHALTATAISAGPAIVGLPTLTEIVAGVLSALPIVSAPAVVGAPAITQKHALSTGAISAGPATFGTPTLEQQHALMAQGITASPATVGATALSEGGAAPFTAEQFLYLEANYVTIANINDIASAVLAALQATAIPVNIKQVNDVTIKGIGTQSNPWNPV